MFFRSFRFVCDFLPFRSQSHNVFHRVLLLLVVVYWLFVWQIRCGDHYSKLFIFLVFLLFVFLWVSLLLHYSSLSLQYSIEMRRFLLMFVLELCNEHLIYWVCNAFFWAQYGAWLRIVVWMLLFSSFFPYTFIQREQTDTRSQWLQVFFFQLLHRMMNS